MANDPPREEAAPVQRELVAIGASAGGVEALNTLVSRLPPELPAALLVAVHVLPTGPSMLPAILSRAGKLRATAATHGERIERARIYVAPPDHHLLVYDTQTHLSHGPRENGHRPALDPLFRSAARAYGRRAVGIVLSGTLDDGSAGLQMMRDHGATTVAQDPADALYAGMPKSAIASGAVQHVVAIAEMADLICRLIDEPVDPHDHPPTEASDSMPGPTLDKADAEAPRDGEASGLTCPECGGALWEHEEGGLVRFMCHVGHAYSPESMQTEQGRALEGALWSALRSLQEREELFRRMASRQPGSHAAARFERRADEVLEHLEAIKRTIADLGRTPGIAAGGADESAA
jgi:two-component system, chemotaxis family, protein-glutamate methylesterase/glutaminase